MRRCSPDTPNMNFLYRLLGALSIGLIWSSSGILNKAYSGPIQNWGDIIPRGQNAYQLVTGDDSEEDRRSWDRLYQSNQYIFGKDPAEFLAKNVGYLQVGRALDIAMGEGRNSIYLAKKGFLVDGVDISEVALRKAKRLARENGVSITPILADLSSYTIRSDFYSVMINFDYLQRNLIAQMKRALKRNGIIIFQNYTVDQLSNPGGLTLPRDILLKRGELKGLFSDFEILVYEETNDGLHAKASLIARKR